MKKLVKKPTPKKRQPMPPGWTRQQIQELAAYYDNQSEDEQFAEHETARKTAGQTMLDVPTELVPDILAFIKNKMDTRRKRKVSG